MNADQSTAVPNNLALNSPMSGCTGAAGSKSLLCTGDTDDACASKGPDDLTTAIYTHMYSSYSVAKKQVFQHLNCINTYASHCVIKHGDR